VGDIDLGLSAMLVALVATIDIGALDGDAGEALDLLDLAAEGVAVIGISGQRLHADDELTAGSACVGHRDRCLHPELVARPRLALGDAFHLGGVQGIELVGVASLLGEDLRHPLAGDGERGLEFLIPGDPAADVAVKPAQPGPQFANPAHRLFVPAAMDQSRDIAAGLAADPQERLAQLDAVLFRQLVQPLDAAHQQVAVGGMGNRLGLHRRVHRDPFASLRRHRSGFHRHAQRFGEQQLKLVGADPVPPARHRRPVQGQLVAEVLLAAEELVIRILDPAGADRLVRQALHVLQQVQAYHQPGRQPGSPLLVVEPAIGLIEPRPVDQPRQFHQRVFHVDHVVELAAEQLVAARRGLLRRHR